ncbi:uncharacterized protein LOC122092367 [Macadamia integrifolia]|uniref:uncharacterized protein LOC122092367 n=1 Tax=Macadamia integrifolia TaxID=60698 RepID=UPI001C527A1C|nr:uncharacterized protein LOC122092367 [Macadamia integrifolia]
MRRIRNIIRCLKKQDGTIVEGRDQLGDYIVQFYEDFHKAIPTIDHVDLLDSIPTVLQQNDIFFLDSIPDDEEIKKAIWELDPDNSPGLDGFTGVFFRRCWNIVEREEFSGQCMSLEKSKLFLGKIPLARKQCISDILGILVCNFSTKYLGVEIFKGRIKKEALFPIMDKVKSRLAGEIDTVRSITVKWDTLCKLKVEGGLGIRRLRDSNKAMLCKLVWKMRKEKSAAASLLRARFVKKDGRTLRGCRPSLIALGKKMWSFVDGKERWIIGNGHLANFWKDKWWGQRSIMEEINLDNSSSLITSTTVGDFIREGQWHLPEVNAPLLKQIFNQIKKVKIPCVQTEDVSVWSLTPMGNFSTASAWEVIRKESPKWKDQVSIASFLLWWKRRATGLNVKKPWKMGVLIITYHLWWERNQRRHETKARQAKFIFESIRQELILYHGGSCKEVKAISDVICCRKLGLSISPSDSSPPLEVHWCRPAPSWIKINVDGNSLSNPGKVGAGGVL